MSKRKKKKRYTISIEGKIVKLGGSGQRGSRRRPAAREWGRRMLPGGVGD